jgi:hypothetical protein
VTLTHRTLGKTTRRVLALVFALLLLAMQQEAGWHALSHLPSLGDPIKQGLQSPSEPCLECTLLASAADLVASAALPIVLYADAVERGTAAPATRFVATRFHYRTRAPPAFS